MARSQSAQLPDFIPPELTTLADKAPDGDRWLHEIKLDGYRAAARIEGGKVRLLTRTGLDWTARFRPIAAALAALPVKTAYLDGEVAIVGPDGVTSFAALQDALSKGGSADLVYFVFDLLHLDGLDLRPLPLIERKGTLKKLLGRRGKAGHIRYSDHVQGQGEAFYAHACRLGLEGIVSKLATSPYRSRRTSEWLKVKCLLRQEMVIGGWQESDKQGRSLKSLLLGYYDRGGALVFAGKAGTGFSLKLGHDLVAQLRKIEKLDPPFAEIPREYRRGSRWAAPRLVAEIAYSNWTTDGVMRHPKFLGLREDKPAREVRLERAASGALPRVRRQRRAYLALTWVDLRCYPINSAVSRGNAMGERGEPAMRWSCVCNCGDHGFRARCSGCSCRDSRTHPRFPMVPGHAAKSSRQLSRRGYPRLPIRSTRLRRELTKANVQAKCARSNVVPTR